MRRMKLAARSAAGANREVIGPPEKTKRGIPAIFVEIVLWCGKQPDHTHRFKAQCHGLNPT